MCLQLTHCPHMARKPIHAALRCIALKRFDKRLKGIFLQLHLMLLTLTQALHEEQDTHETMKHSSHRYNVWFLPCYLIPYLVLLESEECAVPPQTPCAVSSQQC